MVANYSGGAGNAATFNTRLSIQDTGVCIGSTTIGAGPFTVATESDFQTTAHFTSDSYTVLLGQIGYVNNSGAYSGNFPATYASYCINAKRIRATQIDCFSDARAKKDIQVRDGKNDLELLKQLPIKSYKWRDERKGTQEHIGVIAQELEAVVPQAISHSKDFVPNIYMTRDITEVSEKGFTITGEPIGLEGESIKFFYNGADGQEKMSVGILGEGNTLEHNQGLLKETQVFLYGKEVVDFKNVDYTSLSCLHMSATQELARQVAELREIIEQLRNKILE